MTSGGTGQRDMTQSACCVRLELGTKVTQTWSCQPGSESMQKGDLGWEMEPLPQRLMGLRITELPRHGVGRSRTSKAPAGSAHCPAQHCPAHWWLLPGLPLHPSHTICASARQTVTLPSLDSSGWWVWWPGRELGLVSRWASIILEGTGLV